MKIMITLVWFLLMSASAWSMEGTFRCPSGSGLPDSVHEFRMVQIGPDSAIRVPYITSVRHYIEDEGMSRSRPKKMTIKGFATSASDGEGLETFILGSTRFEFVKGELAKCRKDP